MPLDFSTLIPVGDVADPLNLAEACQRMADLLAASGDAVPSVASAGTCSIFAGAGDAVMLVTITGTTGITSFGAHEAGERRLVRFASAGCAVSHSAGLVCPGGVGFTSEAGTLALVVGDGTNTEVWDVRHPSASVAAAAALPPGFLFGLTLENDPGDPTNDVRFKPGKARDRADSANLILASDLIKRLDATWVAGSNQGGLDVGSKANSATYHGFVISNGTDVDALFSLSYSSPTLPGGYSIVRPLGAIITDSGGAIRPFKQVGDEFMLVTPPAVTVSISTTRLEQALTVPAGLVVDALIRITCSAGVAAVVQPLIETDAAVSATATPLFSANDVGAATLSVRTNTSRQIGIKATGAGAAYVITRGWIDRRGRDA